jgi:DNA-binding transcriptional ArsR family regulator
MTKDAFEPAAEFVIDSLETLKVMADPLRLRLIELLGKPRTVKQLAAELNMPPTKLYYHVNQLEQHGLIRTVDTRIVSGIIERQYQNVARMYRVDNNLFSPTSPEFGTSLDLALSTFFDNIKAEIHTSVEAGIIDTSLEIPSASGLNMAQVTSRLSPEQAEAFFRRLDDLRKEFAACKDQPENKNAPVFKLLIVGYRVKRD